MDFGNILSRAWQITWKYRVLWIFGILASCSGQSSYSGQGFNFGVNSTQFAEPGTLPPGVERFFWQLQRSLENITPETMFAITLAIFAFAMILVVIFGLFNVFGRVGLIQGTLQAEAGEAINARSLLSQGARFFWRVLGLNILLNIVVFIVMGTLIFGGLAFSMVTLGIGMLCFIPLICLLIPLSILYYVYIEVANVALISEDIDVFEAIRRGYEVLRANLANFAIMALILAIGGGLLSFLISLPLIALIAPLFIAAISGNQAAISSSIGFLGIGLIIVIPLLILVQGIIRTFIQSAWTFTYTELTAN